MDVGSIRQCCAYNIQSACENKTGTTEWVILISSFPILILAHARRVRIEPGLVHETMLVSPSFQVWPQG